ncbi:MAG: signal peptidase I [Desulfobacteraceae bacterium]|nr:signal peptidase I [Desulfobacteraceae bacterium]MCP4351682.1 signal peptidase I [Desulfobacterales bacterium]
MKETWKKKLLVFWRGWGYSLIIAILIAATFRSAIAEFNDVPTGSMKPTILEGDRLLINKLAYDLKVPFTTWHIACWGHPDRGDIVVFFSPENGRRLVKRVIGVPGNTIAMINNQLFINGKQVKYEALDKEIIDQLPTDQQGRHLFYSENISGEKHPVMITPNRRSLHSFGPMIVPDGQYFMMGDNRDNSADSRYFGFVDRNLIVGRAVGIFISLKYNENYFPRWHRFFQGLS